MSDLTISFTDTLIVVTCWCGINHAVPKDLHDFQMRQFNNGKLVTSIYCPLGHEHQPAGKGEAERLREQLERANAANARRLAELDQTKASLRATKGQVTKLKRRVGNGVCPCCKRTFKQLAQHMERQHPDFVE